jgi:hypothetical protein
MHVLAWLFASIAAFLSPGHSTRDASPPAHRPLPRPGDCTASDCGPNGTRMTGRAIELAGGVDRVTLASGETLTVR